MTPARLLAHFDRLADAPDAVPRLRRFVLDLAVRGKLVPQDPADEPAAELLKQISTERSRLAKEKELPRDTESPDVASDDEPFARPSNWQWVRLGRCLRMVNGRAFKPTDWQTAGMPIVRIQNLNNESAPFNHCNPKDVDERHIIDDGSFLISWSGTPGTSFGAFIWRRGKAALNQHIFSCFQIGAAFNDRFLRLAINGRLDEMISKAHGGAGLQHITKGRLENLVLSLPPLAEQRRIVEKVDELMALCDQLDAAQAEREERRDRLAAAALARLNQPTDNAAAFRDHARFALDHLPRLTTRPEHVAQLRQTILNLAVRGKLVPQDPTDEPAAELLAKLAINKKRAGAEKTGRDWTGKLADAIEIAFTPPTGWTWTRLGNTVERVTVGYVGPMKDHYVEDGVPFLRSQNVRANRFRPDGLIYISHAFHRKIAKSALSPGDVVVVRSGNVGTACVIPNALPEANCSDLVVVKNPVAVLPVYLCYYLNSFAASHIEAGTVGVALTHFNTKSVATMPIPLPPLAEQRRIVARVDELMAVCDQLDAHLTAAHADRGRLLDAVLHDALHAG